MKRYPNVNPRNIQLELNERGEDHIDDFMNRMFELGYGISIDDFGTENFSIGKLRRTVLDKVSKSTDFARLGLKVDKSFIMQFGKEYREKNIDLAVLDLAMAVKRTYPEISLVGEGIESLAALEYLRELGFDYGQGFYIRKPEPLTANYRQPIISQSTNALQLQRRL